MIVAESKMRVALCMLAGAAMLATLASAARLSGEAPLRALLPAGCTPIVQAARGRWFGMPMSYVLFECSLRVQDVAQRLSRAQPLLADLGILPGTVVLSGRDAATQWLAQLHQPSTGRTAGFLSSMAFSPITQPASAAGQDLGLRDGTLLMRFPARWPATAGADRWTMPAPLPSAVRMRVPAPVPARAPAWMPSGGAAPSRWDSRQPRLPAERRYSCIVGRHHHESVENQANE
jgi:hypothetical protein